MVMYEVVYLSSLLPALLLIIRYERMKEPSNLLILIFPLSYLFFIAASNIFGLPTNNWYVYLANIYWLFILSFLIILSPEEVFLKIVKFYGYMGIVYLSIFIYGLVMQTGWGISGLHANYMAMNCLGILVGVFGTTNRKIVLVSTAILTLLICVLLVSRTAIICSLIVISVRYLIFDLGAGSKRVLINKIFRRIFKLSLCAIVSLLLVYVTMGHLIVEFLLLDNSYRGIGSGFSGRTDRWSNALAWIGERPWFGYGYGQSNFIIGYSIDNAYLTVGFEIGILGLMLYLGWIATGLLNMINLKRLASQNNARTCLLVLVTYCIYGFFERRHFNAGNPFSIFFCISMFYCIRHMSIYRIRDLSGVSKRLA